jgi:glycosyltransferase involved in cell wall biosynthesis
MSVQTRAAAPALSALVIAKDEERDLPGCLESLKGLADEIVVLVDEESSDATEEIARAAGCKVVRRKFDDYARQRQAALELCTKGWVLWIDADERVSEALRAAIPAAARGAACAYEIPFEVSFLGRTLRWGGLGGETHVRLFKREGARFVGGQLHEGLSLPGEAVRLAATMTHEPYKTLSEYLEKLDRYTTLAAQKKRAAGKRFHWYHHLVLPGELFKRLVLRLAFLDGFPGVTYACLSAFHHWLKYAKLREMETKP